MAYIKEIIDIALSILYPHAFQYSIHNMIASVIVFCY